jgi:hypothetical protein
MLAPTFRISCLVLMMFIITGCTKDNSNPTYIPDGYYPGSFIFNGDTVFDAIIFEVYLIQEDYIKFTKLNSPSDDLNCDPEILLSGVYEIVIAGDSLEFWKGDETQYQKYKLKKVESSR